MPSSPTRHDLDWVDGFVARIRPHVRVRLSDRVLIHMPNRAFKLNRTGARLLHHLLEGKSVRLILEARPDDGEFHSELRHFFTCLARTLSGAICDSFESPALERVPFHLGYIELPVLSEVALTWRCNLRCRFCYASSTCTSEPAKEAADPGELTTGEVKRLLDIIRHRAEVPSISFTGGEPVLRDDLEELVAYASLILDMRVNLITNGSLVTPAKARALKRAGLASAQVSIESPDPGIHEALVDARNTHARSVSGLIALRDAGIPVHPHATLCRANMDSLDGMASFARSLGVDRFSLNMIIPAGRGVDRGLAVKYSEVKEARAPDQNGRRKRGSPVPVVLANSRLPVQPHLPRPRQQGLQRLRGAAFRRSLWKTPSLLQLEGTGGGSSAGRFQHPVVRYPRTIPPEEGRGPSPLPELPRRLPPVLQDPRPRGT